MTTPVRIVPCGDCHACCKGEAVMLHPEHGDVVESYITLPFVNPVTGERGRRIASKPNRECVYLGPEGCTIWSRRPVICQEFDCRLAFLRISRPSRKRMLRDGLLDQETIDAGRERLDSLTDDERAAALARPRL